MMTLSRHHIPDAGTKSLRSLGAFMVLHRASNHKIMYAKYIGDFLNKKISKLHDWFKSYIICWTVVPASHLLPQPINQPWDCDILLNLECPKCFWLILFYDWKP